jgi:hypothetical protein
METRLWPSLSLGKNLGENLRQFLRSHPNLIPDIKINHENSDH